MKAGSRQTIASAPLTKLQIKTREMLARPTNQDITIKEKDANGNIVERKAITFGDLPAEYRGVISEVNRQGLALPAGLKIEIDHSTNGLLKINGKEYNAAGVYIGGRTNKIYINGKARPGSFDKPRSATLAHEFGHANHAKLFPGSMENWSTARQEAWAAKIERQLLG